jgi:PAS domain S-box-containing protein
VSTLDRSDRSRGEEAEWRLASILEGTPDFVSFADVEGRVLYVNPAGRAMLGIGADEDVSRFNVPDLHPTWATRLLLREGLPATTEHGTWSGETALLARDGREIPVDQVLVAHHGAGREIGFVSTIARDITERKRTEERQELIAEASRCLAASLDYRTTLQNVVDAVVPRFADWCVIAALEEEEIHWVAAAHQDAAKRERLEELLGRRQPLDRDVLVGMHRALVSEEPELVPRVSETWLRAAVRTEETLDLVRELGVHSTIFVPLIARGRTLGAIAFVLTNSDRRYDEADREFADNVAGRAALFIDNARLFQAEQEAVRMRDEVLSIVAHDLRNPLGRIVMGTDLLLEVSEVNEMQRSQLEILRRAADGMNHLIQDLLEVARIESGHGLTVDRQRWAVTPLLADACDLLQTAAEEKGLRLACIGPGGELFVEADRDRFIQIMSNLIGNAVKFTDRGEIMVRAEHTDEGVRFSVADTGPGIAEEDLARLFDRFWQARRSRRGGAGLGLAITRGLVEAHDGHLRVESEVGRGTTFHFTLPVCS